MERETAGCLFLDKNPTTSVDLLLSLNYHDIIIDSSIAAYSILFYIQGAQGISQVLMNEPGMKKHCYFVFSYWLLPRDLNAHRVSQFGNNFWANIIYVLFIYKEEVP